MLELPVFYANGRVVVCGKDLKHIGENLYELLDCIIDYIPSPVYDDEEPFQMLVSDLSYSDFLGRLAVGKVINGSVSTNDSLVCMKVEGEEKLRVTRLQAYDRPVFKEVQIVAPGAFVVLCVV